MAWKVISLPSSHRARTVTVLFGWMALLKPSTEKISLPVRPQAVQVFAGLELQRQDSHPDQVGAMDALE